MPRLVQLLLSNPSRTLPDSLNLPLFKLASLHKMAHLVPIQSFQCLTHLFLLQTGHFLQKLLSLWISLCHSEPLLLYHLVFIHDAHRSFQFTFGLLTLTSCQPALSVVQLLGPALHLLVLVFKLSVATVQESHHVIKLFAFIVQSVLTESLMDAVLHIFIILL